MLDCNGSNTVVLAFSAIILRCIALPCLSYTPYVYVKLVPSNVLPVTDNLLPLLGILHVVGATV